MSRNTVRIMSSLGLIVGATTAYPILFLGIENHLIPSNGIALLVTSTISAPVFTVVWIRIWARAVMWDRRTMGRTGIAVAASLGTALAVATSHMLAIGTAWGDEEGVILATAAYGGAWIAASAWAWADQVRTGVGGPRIICPKCNYDMRGLDQPRCPECGSRYTLDELLAANTPDREG